LLAALKHAELRFGKSTSAVFGGTRHDGRRC
jgi:hypothetical protein